MKHVRHIGGSGGENWGNEWTNARSLPNSRSLRYLLRCMCFTFRIYGGLLYFCCFLLCCFADALKICVDIIRHYFARRWQILALCLQIHLSLLFVLLRNMPFTHTCVPIYVNGLARLQLLHSLLIFQHLLGNRRTDLAFKRLFRFVLPFLFKNIRCCYFLFQLFCGLALFAVA